jgi:hypothetical protein
MVEIENKIKVVLRMLLSDTAWEYQRFKSHNEEKSINSFVARNTALSKAKEMIEKELTNL